jgi:hypothetical protein
MAYTVRTTRSYGSRVKSSFSGMLTGLVLFVGATVLLWWNEGRAVKTDKMLNEAEGVCVDVEDVSKVDPELDGQMIHATAPALTSDSLYFSTFGVGANAIALSKSAKYYQWVEHKHEERHDKVGGSEEIVTTYTYTKEWVSSPINSSSFADPSYQNIFNKPVLTTDAEEIYATNVSFGAYTLPSNIIQRISGSSPAYPQPTDEQLKAWDSSIKDFRQMNRLTVYDKTATFDPAAVKNIPVGNDSVKSDSAKATTPAPVENAPVLNNKYEATYVHVVDNQLYFGYNPSVPEVGDVIITFNKVDQGTISILATVSGNTFKKYTAKNKHSFLSVERGEVSMEQMFQNEHDANTTLTWILRIIGVLAVIAGLRMIFDILTTLLKVLPFLASIMNFGTSLVCNIVGVVWSLIVIALAWLFYRPLIGIAILLVAGFIIFYFNKKAKEKKAAAVAAGEPEPPAVE